MSATIVPLVIEALTELIPLVRMLMDQAKNGTVPSADDEAKVNAALDAANAAIQAT